jgi:hypothetical protein
VSRFRAGRAVRQCARTTLTYRNRNGFPPRAGGLEATSRIAPRRFLCHDRAIVPTPQQRLALVFLSALGVACSEPPAPAPPVCNGSASLCGRRFDEVAFAMTHNAMAVDDEGFAAANQHNGMDQQLADGIRGMMLDVHRFEDAGVWLCHGSCGFGKKPLLDGLLVLKAFLDAHPRELLTLEIEPYVPANEVAAVFEAAGLGSYVHTQVLGQPWPTLGAMLDAHHPLVVFYEDGAAGDATAPAWYMPLFKYSFDTPYHAETPAELTCTLGRGAAGNALFTLNHFLTSPVAAPDLAEQVNHDPFLIDRARACQTAFGHIPNFVAVDYYDIGDVVAAVRRLNGE